MTTMALHQPPERMSVLRQQIRAVGVQLRGPAIMLLVGLIVIGAIVVGFAASQATQRPDLFGFPLQPTQTMPVWFIGLLAAAALWQRDEPSRRGYHLAMPVNASTHTGMRVLAGWGWLMVAIAGYLVLLVGMGLVVATIGGGRLTFEMTSWLWLEPFAAATMCYLLASIPLVASEKPILWLLGPPAVVGALLSMPALYHARDAARLVEKLMMSPFSPTAPFYPVYYFPPPDFRHVAGVNAEYGLIATVFWTAVGLAGVWLAARQKPRAAR